jgi:hypothetical protein
MQNEITEPGNKKSQMYYKKWMLFAPVGLLLVGFGMCVFGTALFKMRDNAPFIEWFLWGTGSLLLINSGLCFFGSAIKYSILYELTRKEKDF